MRVFLFRDTKNVELPDYPKSRVSYFDARTEVIQFSLISQDMKNSALRIHRLVQDVVRENLQMEGRFSRGLRRYSYPIVEC